MAKKVSQKDRLQEICVQAFDDARAEIEARKARGIDATEIFGLMPGEWVRCFHCGRCYQIGEFRLEDGLQMCPYPDCDGDTVFDTQRWAGEGIPERGVVYPLYA